MSIYMVQHSFSKPEWEQEWNEWYAGNLPILMRVPGFYTGQRFKSPDGNPPRYMAVYTVDADVFESQFYLDSGGGGTNSARFRPAYQVWIRNLFEGITKAPNIGPDEYLVLVDDVERNWHHPDIKITWLETTGFHKTTPWRGIGVARADQIDALRGDERVIVYQAITDQMGPLY